MHFQSHQRPDFMRHEPAAGFSFDLDGTLLDTAPDMIGALNRLRSSTASRTCTRGAAPARVARRGAPRQGRLSDVTDNFEPPRRR
jgi:hypothetical protein